MKLAILGTRGVPANYGGFETLAEELGRRLADRGHEVTVYGRRGFVDPALDSYRTRAEYEQEFVIGTPDHWHAVQTIWACREGKDVFCEKPLSLTIREARAMVHAARRYQRVVQTGSQSRSNGRIRFGCDVVRQGRIGKVREVHVTCGPSSVPCNLPAEPVPDYLDWEMWLGPAPWRPSPESTTTTW